MKTVPVIEPVTTVPVTEPVKTVAVTEGLLDRLEEEHVSVLVESMSGQQWLTAVMLLNCTALPTGPVT